jgi:hypothetical protein
MATWRPDVRSIIDGCFDNLYGGSSSDGSESDDSGGKSADESSGDVTTKKEGGDSSLTQTRATMAHQVEEMPLFEICAATPDSDADSALSSDESVAADGEVEEEPGSLSANVSAVDSPSSTDVLMLVQHVENTGTAKRRREVHQELEQEPATKRKRQQQSEKDT